MFDIAVIKMGKDGALTVFDNASTATLLNKDFVEENEGHLEIEPSNTETNIKGIGGQAVGKTVKIKLRKRGGTSGTKFTAVIVPDITTIWRKNLEPFEKLVKFFANELKNDPKAYGIHE